jgi:hypothetical protein
MLDPFRGIADELMDLIDNGQYFVIHAARQSGKTTLLKELVNRINAQGDYYAMYCSLEAVGTFTEPEKGIPEIVGKIRNYIRHHNLSDGFAKDADYSRAGDVLNWSLVDYCRSLDKPLVIFFDEADCLGGETLISFLRQLREGYISRASAPFVHSVALIGLRDLRDYKVQIRPDSTTLGIASPFNIAKKSFTLRNFTQTEVVELYAQHTAETGQIFEPQATEYVFEQTQGQPWLVNAIACNCVEKITKKNYSIPITKDLADQAIQNLILEWGVHFDSMMDKLQEPRVRSIIKPLILGEDVADRRSNDYLYTKDLGLIRELNGRVEPANPIYAELMIRTLNWNPLKSIEGEYENYTVPRYLKDGKLDMDFLIRDFQAYWRENSEIWVTRYKTHLYQYDEAAAHLVIQAFFQRVINGGGYIIREMALGRKRADLCVVYDNHKYPVELKILRKEQDIAKGLEQLSIYMDKVGSDAGWLVLFDRDTEKCWDEKIYTKEEIVDGKRIVVVGC